MRSFEEYWGTDYDVVTIRYLEDDETLETSKENLYVWEDLGSV